MCTARQKQAHRYRKRTHGYQWGQGGERGNLGLGTEKCNLLCIKYRDYTAYI